MEANQQETKEEEQQIVHLQPASKFPSRFMSQSQDPSPISHKKSRAGRRSSMNYVLPEPKSKTHKRSKSDELLYSHSWDRPEIEESHKKFFDDLRKDGRLDEKKNLKKSYSEENDFLDMLEEEEEEEEDEEETPAQAAKQELETREEDKLLIGLKPGGDEELLGGTWDALIEGLMSKRFGKIIWDQQNTRVTETSPGALITPPFVKDFFFTYRYFAELSAKSGTRPAHELLSKVTGQYPLRLPEDATPELQSLQSTIQLRIIGIIKHWVDNHFYDFEEDSMLYEHLISFVVSIVVNESANLGVRLWTKFMLQLINEKLIKSINKGIRDPALFALRTQYTLQAPLSLQVIAVLLEKADFVFDHVATEQLRRSFSGIDAVEWIGSTLIINKPEEAISVAQQLLNAGHIICSNDKVVVFNTKEMFYFPSKKLQQQKSDELPKPILPPKSDGLTIMDINATELARQMTLADYDCLMEITPKELSHQAWSKPDARSKSPNIINMIERFNRTSYWVATEVVTCPNFKNRVSLLKRFITLADECRKINNFSSMIAILVGLNQGSVTRLKETWKALPKNVGQLAQTLTEHINTSHNHRTYRTAYKQAMKEGAPIIPYLAVNLRDLTFIEDGNQNLRPNGMVNFEKMAMLSSVFSEIHTLQQRPFRFQRVEFIQKFLKELHIINDDKELYKYSTIAEGTMRAGTIGSSSSRTKAYPTADAVFDRKKLETAPPLPPEMQQNGAPHPNAVGRRLSLMNTFKKVKKDKKDEKVSIKVVVVGDGVIGKTSLCKCFVGQSTTTPYVSTITESYDISKTIDDYKMTIQLVDTGGIEDLLKARMAVYGDTDFVLVCYSVTNYTSFKNVQEKWIPEIHKYCPGALVALVGCKEDLKDSPAVKDRGEKIVSLDDGDIVCGRIGGLFHLQCSSARNVRIEEIFERLVKNGVPLILKKKKKKEKEKEKDKVKRKPSDVKVSSSKD